MAELTVRIRAAMTAATVRAARGTMVTRVVLGAVVAGVLVVRQVYMGSVLEVCEGDGEDVDPADDERAEEGADEEVGEREEGGEDAHASYLSCASTVGRLITPRTIKPADNPDSRALTMLLVSERITGWTEDTYVSSAMWRGVEDEPRAVETYSQAYAPVETVGFMVRDDGGCRIGYSPDGLVGNDGLIEVKSRSPKEHVRVVIEDAVPAEHMAQLQCGLLVSGR